MTHPTNTPATLPTTAELIADRPRLQFLVATKIMGWPVADSAESVVINLDKSDYRSWTIPWNPDTDWAHAGAVVEAMNKNPRNICVAFSPVTDKWLVQFLSFRNADGTFNVKCGGSFQHESAPLAISLAALLAVGAAKETA